MKSISLQAENLIYPVLHVVGSVSNGMIVGYYLTKIFNEI